MHTTSTTRGAEPLSQKRLYACAIATWLHPQPIPTLPTLSKRFQLQTTNQKTSWKIKNPKPHFAFRIHFHKTPLNIQNNTSWVFQPVNKTTIVFFYYNCNYKFVNDYVVVKDIVCHMALSFCNYSRYHDLKVFTQILKFQICIFNVFLIIQN
jgi:hypothetical protein